MFVKNKEFSNVLTTAFDSVKEHDNYLTELNTYGDSWKNYSFHLNGDRNRELEIAIMLYHLG
ncbi:hypothetical protein J2S05_003769 [Alkalicoccobacillus murimartini]|uniref:Uncharacterized protein n=1 Tax=Alkalicoccobacillus murimartini TaxID=171685 RepID=A0ABT9YM45_9BACI|nr:hypothetical protein [Alkalicoccobacillus murimartini]